VTRIEPACKTERQRCHFAVDVALLEYQGNGVIDLIEVMS
jgi:hypothetical protein